MRASEDQTRETVGVIQRELLRDHPAHRDAEHRGASDSERVHQPLRVGGHLANRIGRRRLVAAAGPAIVELQQAKNARQDWSLLIPRAKVRTESPDHRQRLRALAVDLVVDVDARNFELWHEVILRAYRVENQASENGRLGRLTRARSNTSASRHGRGADWRGV